MTASLNSSDRLNSKDNSNIGLRSSEKCFLPDRPKATHTRSDIWTDGNCRWPLLNAGLVKELYLNGRAFKRMGSLLEHLEQYLFKR